MGVAWGGIRISNTATEYKEPYAVIFFKNFVEDFRHPSCGWPVRIFLNFEMANNHNAATGVVGKWGVGNAPYRPYN